MGGKFPLKSGIVVTHTDTLAKEHGRDCRDYWLGMGFALTFGLNSQGSLRTDSQASDRLQTEKASGVVTFSGRGGLGAGVGADWMTFDDFFKNSQEAGVNQRPQYGALSSPTVKAASTTRIARW